MMRYLSLALALLAVSAAQAEGGGLRRLRRNVADNNEVEGSASVHSNFLNLAKEVDGQALHRVLRHKQARQANRGRKMLTFGSYMELLRGRDHSNDGFPGFTGPIDGRVGEEPIQPIQEEAPLQEDVEPAHSMSLSLSLSMSLPLNSRVDDVEGDSGDFVNEGLSLSLSLSMSLPLDSRIKDGNNNEDNTNNDNGKDKNKKDNEIAVEPMEDIVNDAEDLSLSLSLSMSI